METPPSIGPNFKQLATSQFYIELPDEIIWQYRGVTYGWQRIAKAVDLINEIATRAGADSSIITNLNAEIARATAAEDLLQPKTDYNLNTTDKTVTGSINEILVVASALTTRTSASVTGNGQNFVIISELIGQVVSTAFRQGVGYTIGTVANDLNQVAVFDSTLGKISFENVLTGENVFAEYSGIQGGSEALDTLLDVSAKVNEVISHGAQYANKALIVLGSYVRNSDGVLKTDTPESPDATAASYARTAPTFLTGGEWTVSGILTDFAGWLYSSDTPTTLNKISKIAEPLNGTTQATFTVPDEGAWAVVNIERTVPNALGTKNNTVFLAKGTNTTYEPYVGFGVSGTRIFGKVNGSPNDEQFNPVKGAVDAIVELSYEHFANFNGTTSKVPLPTSYTLDAIGDYIEFVSKFTGSGNDGLSMLGVRQTSGNQFNKLGYFAPGEIGLKGDTSTDPYVRWVIPDGTNTLRKYRLEVVLTGWQLSVDDVIISIQAKPRPLTMNTVGNAYRGTFAFKGGIQSIKIHNTTQDITIEDLSALPNAVDVVNTYVEKSSGEVGVVYPAMLYSFDPTGGFCNAGIASTYQHYGDGSNKYLRIDVEHQLEEDTRSDLYRVRDNEVVDYDIVNNTVTGTGLRLLHTSENETTIGVSGKPDHTGGYHGDEKLTAINFYVDYQPMPLTTAIPLTVCNSFHYTQMSNLLDTDNPTEVTVMKQSKITRFLNFGYVTESVKTPVSTVNISLAYGALFCVHVDQSQKAYTDDGNVVTALRDGNNSPYAIDQFFNKTINYYNASTKLGAKATGDFPRVIRSGLDKTIDLNLISHLIGWDRSTDFKLYYRASGVGNLFVGDYLYSKGSIAFYRKP